MKLARGVSLVELTATVALLGIIALVVIPNLSSTDPKKLELAVTRVASALQFARNEAKRTGEMRAVIIDNDGTYGLADDLAVLENITAWVGGKPTGDLDYHPLSKQPYSLDVTDIPMSAGVAFDTGSKPFSYQNVTGNHQVIYFTDRGRPVWTDGVNTQRLLSGVVKLRMGDLKSSVTLHPVTGKVKVQ